MTTSTLSPARRAGTATAHPTAAAYAVAPPTTYAAPPTSAASTTARRSATAPTTHTAAGTSTRPTTRTTPDRVPLLALIAPLLLFTHGIVDWVDGLDTLDGFPGLGGFGGLAAARDQGTLSVTAGVLLVVSVAGFAWLTASLGARLRHLPLAVPTALLAAFGAGATATVWLGQVTGLLGDALPVPLAIGGAVLTTVALAVVLVSLALEGRLPVGSLALSAVAAGVLVLPWDLGPLASLLLLIGLAPLTRPTETP